MLLGQVYGRVHIRPDDAELFLGSSQPLHIQLRLTLLLKHPGLGLLCEYLIPPNVLEDSLLSKHVFFGQDLRLPSILSFQTPPGVFNFSVLLTADLLSEPLRLRLSSLVCLFSVLPGT